MATVTEVEVGMAKISNVIVNARKRLKSAKEDIAIQEANLNAISDPQSEFADILATINGYTPSGVFEELYKDSLTKKTTEFLALKAEATAAKNDLGTYTEF